MDLQALKSELTTGHPGTGPYSSDDVTAANQLNEPNREPQRGSLTGGEIASAVDGAELAALTPEVRQRYVMALFACGSIPATQNFKQNLAGMFGAQSETRANLLAIFKRPGSRAEELGLGFVTPSDVAAARRLP